MRILLCFVIMFCVLQAAGQDKEIVEELNQLLYHSMGSNKIQIDKHMSIFEKESRHQTEFQFNLCSMNIGEAHVYKSRVELILKCRSDDCVVINHGGKSADSRMYSFDNMEAAERVVAILKAQ